MKIIGISGMATSGKDTFCLIAKEILEKNGFRVKQYSFAKILKDEIDPFLTKVCGVSAWTKDPEEKKDIRDFLVWYGTTWWRKRDPKRWIRGVDLNLKSDKDNVDYALVSDARYPNEGEWVHSWEGYLVHISAYKIETTRYELGGKWIKEKNYLNAPNEQERMNDPLMKEMSDYKVEWEAKGLTPEQAVADKDLRITVLEALNSSPFFNDALSL